VLRRQREELHSGARVRALRTEWLDPHVLTRAFLTHVTLGPS
jgi:hypothetical protein